jgi:iron complex outermembrane recepter protein
MRNSISFLQLFLLIWVNPAAVLAAQTQADSDVFEFFAAEAQVVTAARRPSTIRRAPATVYLVTREDIAASGAQTLWDALRGVPGVDVMSARTAHGEVSVRGLNRLQNNRTLVLLDGKTVLNGFFDYVVWEEIPVTLEEIDRIEIVEGPASALYGANAVNGVINIITRTPEQLDGGLVSISAGERQTFFGSLLYGDSHRLTSYKVGAGWRVTNRFEDADQRAARVLKAHLSLDRKFSVNSQLRLSGGIAGSEVQISTAGGAGLALVDGTSGFLRADYNRSSTQMRAFWNWGRGTWKEFTLFDEPDTDYDTYDVTLEHTLALSSRNELTAGGSYRRNTMRSGMFPKERIDQNLWTLFFEDTWRSSPFLTLVASGRLDRHPLTGEVFSPRLSAIYHPGDRHVFRLSTGTAFRNPTLTENYIQASQSFANPGAPLPNPPFTTIRMEFVGNRDLNPEKLRFCEAAHSARWGDLKTTAVGFHYRLRGIISGVTSGMNADSTTITIQNSFGHEGTTRVWGGELGAEFLINRTATLYANYAYQRFSGDVDDLAAEEGGPRHKINAGARLRPGHFTLDLQAHWVDSTEWDAYRGTGVTDAAVDSYLLLNGGLTYRFSGSWHGTKVRLSAFNLTDDQHFQILPELDADRSGQRGEIIRRRVLVTLSREF